ncbi:MAG: twin-arginine translocase TatA/TatE family subunit [Lentisphaerae bacterium]|nr:twin-arginine translocase TatA/TatE family subunit [Lentisphaerota bacterium]
MTPCISFLSGAVGGGEILLLALLVLIFFGPKELPRLLRTFGDLSRKLRDASDEFRRQIERGERDLEEGIHRSITKDLEDTRPHETPVAVDVVDENDTDPDDEDEDPTPVSPER